MAGTLTIAALLLNAGHWSRNLSLWHHPLGNPEWLVQYQNESLGISETLSNVVRNMALHVVTPSTKVNAFTGAVVRRVDEILGISTSEPLAEYRIPHS